MMPTVPITNLPTILRPVTNTTHTATLYLNIRVITDLHTPATMGTDTIDLGTQVITDLDTSVTMGTVTPGLDTQVTTREEDIVTKEIMDLGDKKILSKGPTK